MQEGAPPLLSALRAKLDDTGIIAKLKAELRAAIIAVLSSESPPSHPPLATACTDELALIYDWLTCHGGLPHTRACLLAEAGLSTGDIPSRARMAATLDLATTSPSSSGSRALLSTLVAERSSRSLRRADGVASPTRPPPPSLPASECAAAVGRPVLVLAAQHVGIAVHEAPHLPLAAPAPMPASPPAPSSPKLCELRPELQEDAIRSQLRHMMMAQVDTAAGEAAHMGAAGGSAARGGGGGGTSTGASGAPRSPTTTTQPSSRWMASPRAEAERGDGRLSPLSPDAGSGSRGRTSASEPASAPASPSPSEVRAAALPLTRAAIAAELRAATPPTAERFAHGATASGGEAGAGALSPPVRAARPPALNAAGTRGLLQPRLPSAGDAHARLQQLPTMPGRAAAALSPRSAAALSPRSAAALSPRSAAALSPRSPTLQAQPPLAASASSSHSSSRLSALGISGGELARLSAVYAREAAEAEAGAAASADARRASQGRSPDGARAPAAPLDAASGFSAGDENGGWEDGSICEDIPEEEGAEGGHRSQGAPEVSRAGLNAAEPEASAVEGTAAHPWHGAPEHDWAEGAPEYFDDWVEG